MAESLEKPAGHLILRIIGLSLAYFVAGRVALLLAIPPGYAAAVWPASGIALAGCLTLGPGVWPGVFIGSFLTNLSTSYDPLNAASAIKSMAIPAVIAAGAVVQALLGSYLVRRFGGWPNQLPQADLLLKAMLIGGPLTSLTNATIANAGLVAAGEIPSGQFAHSWMVWWVGDTLGVSIVLPLAAVWAAESYRASRRVRFFISLPLGLCCLMTTLAFYKILDAEIETARMEFVQQAEIMARSVEETIDLKIDIVHSIVSLFQIGREITRDQFRDFVQNTFDRHPDLRGFSWNVVVDREERSQLEQAAAEEGYPDFRITEVDDRKELVEAGERSEYVVVFFIEPYEGNEAALGFDLKSDPVRARALALAHQSRSVVATQPVILVQDKEQKPGFLFFAPIYRPNSLSPEAIESDRPDSYVSAVFQAEPFVDRILRPFSRMGISAKIQDSSAPTETAVIYGEAKTEEFAKPDLELTFSRELAVGGQVWQLEFWSNERYHHRDFREAWSMLTGGLFLTSLLGILLFVIASRNALTEQAVVKRTAALRRSNRSLRTEIAQRRKAEEALEFAREELEVRVEKRTADLVRANENLRTEIRERERVEFSLVSSEKRFRAIFDASTIGIAIADSRGIFLEANDYVHKMLGYEAGELVGKGFADISAGKDVKAAIGDLRQIREGGKITLQGERRYECRDGRFVWALVRSTAIFQGERLQYVLSVIEDVTMRKRMEEEFSKAEKLDSIGVLAGGIAHDFNNLLTAISGNLELAKRKDSSSTRPFLNEALKASRRAAQLTRQLLTFSKGGAPLTKPVDLLELVRECTAFALRGSKSCCQFQVSDELWPAAVDTSQISQVISNLIINADQAMPQGGHVIVGMRNLQVEAHNGVMLEPGRFIEISIADHGVGIPAENRSRIFDPYFTTKQGGSGLGLATAYSVIKRHQGHIAVESEPGEGTKFRVYLPATSEVIERSRVQTPKPVSIRKGRILVMDDDRRVRRLMMRFLSTLGYEVEIAPDGQEAIRLFAAALRRRKPFHVVILDLTVPGGMGGRETIARLKELSDVRALVSSGYSEDRVLSDFREYGFGGAVIKPFRLADVGRAIELLLEEPIK